MCLMIIGIYKMHINEKKDEEKGIERIFAIKISIKLENGKKLAKLGQGCRK